jgi:hypothetical protein
MGVILPMASELEQGGLGDPDALGGDDTGRHEPNDYTGDEFYHFFTPF